MKPKTLADLDPVTAEALACHEALGRLGFVADEIFLVLALAGNPEYAIYPAGLAMGDLAVHVELRAQGEEFTITVGAVPGGADDFERRWPAVIETWKAAPRADVLALWERSVIKQRALELVLGLQHKGIRTSAPKAWKDSS